MNLIWFLTIATILSTVLGEFGQFPFGSPNSISVTDVLLTLTLSLFFVWKIAIQKKIFWPKEFKILIAFWLVGLISLFFSGVLQGGLYLIRFIFYSNSFLIGYFLVQEKKIDLFNILRVSAITGVFFVLLGFLQLIFLSNFDQLSLLGYDPHQNRLTSTFLDPNYAAAFLVFMLSFTVINYFHTKRKEWVFVAVLLLFGIGLTFSRSGYLMFLVVALLFGLFKERKILFLLIPLLLISFLIPPISQRILSSFTVDASAKERIESWQNGLYVFSQRPILGVGFDNLRTFFARYNLFKTFSATGGNAGAGVDSSFIVVLATTGVMGLTVYLWWWSRVIWQSFRMQEVPIKTAGLIIGCLFLGLFIESQFINSLFYPPIMLMIYLTAGSLVGSKEISPSRIKKP